MEIFFQYQEADGWKGLNGVHYDNPVDFIHEGLFCFCGCANPKYFLKYVKLALLLIHEVMPAFYDKKINYVQLEQRKQRLYHGYHNELLMRYFLEERGITQHGGNVTTGWLTPIGVHLLEVLKIILKK